MLNKANIEVTQAHQTQLYRDKKQPIAVIIYGWGNIGQQFIELLRLNSERLNKLTEQTYKLVAVANSRFYQLDQAGLLNQHIQLSYATATNQSNCQNQIWQSLQALAGHNAVVIDLTASERLAKNYLQFAQNGWHIISANKIAAADHIWAQRVEQELKNHQSQWLKNTTVGAALPIQDSIRKIKASGDQINKVTGVFSGSLSWLFGNYDGQTEFMRRVKQAQENAYTEPDPREDLSGQDVYRKALILAQELGFEPKQVTFKPVLPAEYLAGSIDDFWQNQAAINKYIKSLWQQANQNGQQLRYLASIGADELRVELVAVDDDHAAARLKPGDNIFIIESAWYSDNPLVIQGPGAGREVTAAGVLTDLIEVLQSS